MAQTRGVVIIECPPLAPEVQRAALMPADVAILPCRPWTLDESREDYFAAFKKAAKGDNEAMGLVRGAFDETPGRWRYPGNMESHARQAIAEAACGKDNLPQIEAALRMMAAKEAEIAPSDASRLEKLLAERVTICWFETSHKGPCNRPAAAQAGCGGPGKRGRGAGERGRPRGSGRRALREELST